VDVGQIVAGYTLETGLSVNGTIQGGPDALALGGHGTYTDRPTITYTPLTGNRFVKSLMTPFTPESVFFTIQSGWPADAVLLIATASLNGLKNQDSTFQGTTPPEPDFLRAVALMRKIQLSGGVALRIQQDGEKAAALLAFRRPDVAPETAADAAELRRLLRLDPEATEFRLVFGATAVHPTEVAVLTRSMLRLMQLLAGDVEVPAQDLAERRVTPGWESVENADGDARMIRIHSSKARPTDAFVVVRYRDHWFWIDDRDLRSKRVFAFMMQLFTLADTGDKESLPLITIPA
jgi:hypothetical protein